MWDNTYKFDKLQRKLIYKNKKYLEIDKLRYNN